MEEKREKINYLIEDSIENLEGLADSNYVIGTPITTASGLQIIPFSKVTMGNLAGGGEYGDVKVVKESGNFPFAGGSGNVVSMKPLGFLVDNGKSCKILRVTDEPLDNLVERVSDIVQNILSKE